MRDSERERYMQQHDRWAHELQNVLHHEIPLSRDIRLEVSHYDGESLSLRAPLAPNINHKATAFAGSLNAVTTLAGWGTAWLMLREHGLRGTIVIQESTTRYLLPVSDDFTATCRVPSEQTTERFLAGLRRRGKARLPLTVSILTGDGQIAVAFTGHYVAFAHASNQDDTEQEGEGS